MSLYTQIQVCCDVCEEVFIEELDDPDDVDYAVERDGGAMDVEINDTYYAHVCENCYNEVSYCEACDKNIWSDETYWCEDFVMCGDCVGEQHTLMLEDNTIEVEENMCTSCDWEFDEPLKEITRKALVTL